jgi:hypothetical protein
LSTGNTPRRWSPSPDRHDQQGGGGAPLLQQRLLGVQETLAAVAPAAQRVAFLQAQVAADGVGRQLVVLAHADHAVPQLQGHLHLAQHLLHLVERQVAGRELLADAVEQFQRLVGALKLAGLFLHLVGQVGVHGGNLADHGVEGLSDPAELVLTHMGHPGGERTLAHRPGRFEQLRQRLHQLAVQQPDRQKADHDDAAQQHKLDHPQPARLVLQFDLDQMDHLINLIHEGGNLQRQLVHRPRVTAGSGQLKDAHLGVPALQQGLDRPQRMRRIFAARLAAKKALQAEQAPLEDLDGVGGLGAPLGLQHLAEGAVAQEAQRTGDVHRIGPPADVVGDHRRDHDRTQ